MNNQQPWAPPRQQRGGEFMAGGDRRRRAAANPCKIAGCRRVAGGRFVLPNAPFRSVRRNAAHMRSHGNTGGGSRGSPGGPWTTLDFGPGAPPPSPRRPKRKKAQQRLGLVGSRGEPQRRTAQARSPLRSNPPPNRVASPLLSRLRHSLRSPRSSSPPPLALRRSGRCQRHRPSAARARRGNTPAGGGHDSTPAAPHGGDGASASGPSPSCSTSRRLCSSLPLVPYYPAPLPLAPGRPAPASRQQRGRSGDGRAAGERGGGFARQASTACGRSSGGMERRWDAGRAVMGGGGRADEHGRRRRGPLRRRWPKEERGGGGRAPPAYSAHHVAEEREEHGDNGGEADELRARRAPRGAPWR
ncbi:hypothetical protein DAI22_02g295600 [Oryza sativa Japonica Group]|nr:hypothetical protein DAI22_02g295600 [Oryza sativa Japonica Group]